ncbi:MAG: molecular chaperone TorD family protein [Candidatus Thiodiazotropha lotti]|uniref:Molecular chaperone TorD family protein n=1 Tax=Candidatus Thiodiazotropha lotti TaxID=2792787 RepID=A0A9E4MZY3_9GAMM|nr:molecular chaperone TorD family protein [Candidatus Thiodiazotropha lotti]MCW4203160.1 molecular chaperone TorD family protein [Candidatus Thiodiazotropha lotti]
MKLVTDPNDNSNNAQIKSFLRVISDDFLMLTRLHAKEPDADFLELLVEYEFPSTMALNLVSEEGKKANQFMQRVIEMMPEQFDDEYLDTLAADFADIYLNHSLQASPLESVWIDEEKLTCQESMFQVRAWYESYGLKAENWRIRPDDDLVLQLQFISHLFSISESIKELEDIARFMDEHLLRWLGQFTSRVVHRSATPYYSGIALLTGAYCEELRDLIATITNLPRPSAEEIEERMKCDSVSQEVTMSYMPGIGPAV